MVDLHTHTTASDGTCSPSRLVALAKQAGLSALAVTDHDTTDGLAEATAAGNKVGIHVVPGIEISAGDMENMHIVGLYIQPEHPALQQQIARLKADRRRRNVQVIENLRKLGFQITYQEVEEGCPSRNLGRVHIARFMEQKGLVDDFRRAFRDYLEPGKPGYVPPRRLSAKEAIGAILQAGGIPVLAHIHLLHLDEPQLERTVTRLAGCGLKGIEVRYPGYSKTTQTVANQLAERLGLLKSGGTDFHGDNRPGVALGVGDGSLIVPDEYLLAIQQAAGTGL